MYVKVHLVGAGGIGMKAIAELLHYKYNTIVEGTDRNIVKSDIIKYKGINDEKNVSNDIDCLIYSGILVNHPEVQYAKSRNIPVYHRAEFLGKYLDVHIGIAGTYGKTYTTGATSHIFDDYLYIIGGHLLEKRQNNYLASRAIVEIDESDNTMHYFNVEIGIITGVRYEHLDFYESKENYIKALSKFANSCQTIIIQYQDKDKLKIDDSVKVYTYGFDKNADFYIDENGYIERLNHRIISDSWIVRLNNTAAMIAGHLCNRDIKRIDSYQGVERRCEITEYKEYTIINDYAVHPFGMSAVIDVIKQKYQKPITVFLQPHNHERLNKLGDEIINAMKQADEVIVLPIHAVLHQGSQSNFIKKILNNENTQYSETAAIAIQNKIVIFFGAGNIKKYIDEFKKCK